jgi:hypothetical protein
MPFGQIREELRDVFRPERRRMAPPVKQDVPADPKDVRFFGAAAHVPCPQSGPDAVEELRRSSPIDGWPLSRDRHVARRVTIREHVHASPEPKPVRDSSPRVPARPTTW